jgi:hypothetical protein
LASSRNFWRSWKYSTVSALMYTNSQTEQSVFLTALLK